MSTCVNQVFISYALMEASKIGETDEDEDEAEADAAQVEAEIEGDTGDPEKARAVFERGYKALKERGEKEDVSPACGWVLSARKLTSFDHASVWYCWKPGRHSRRSKARPRTYRRYKR